MNIDVTEIMKTGLFGLRYEKCGDVEELVITPVSDSFSIHDGEERGSESNFPFEYPKGWTDNELVTDGWVDWEFTDNLKDFTTWEENIPWHMIPERFNWVAQDDDGEWFAHEDRPIIEDGEWVSVGYICYIEYPLSNKIPTLPDFTESLVRRPDYEQKTT